MLDAGNYLELAIPDEGLGAIRVLHDELHERIEMNVENPGNKTRALHHLKQVLTNCLNVGVLMHSAEAAEEIRSAIEWGVQYAFDVRGLEDVTVDVLQDTAHVNVVQVVFSQAVPKLGHSSSCTSVDCAGCGEI